MAMDTVLATKPRAAKLRNKPPHDTPHIRVQRRHFSSDAQWLVIEITVYVLRLEYPIRIRCVATVGWSENE